MRRNDARHECQPTLFIDAHKLSIYLSIQPYSHDISRDSSSPSDDDDIDQRNEKISNNSSFGIIDIADDSSTSDRIIVIVDTACFIHDGAR